jgi:hypothetical protein
MLGCKDSKSNFKSNSLSKNKNIKETTLELKVELLDYGTYEVDVKDWKNNLYDTVAYFHISLKNLKKEPFVIKIDLIATNIPFLIEYRKVKKKSKFINKDGIGEEYINLNINQQFNTIYVDSLILRVNAKTDYPHLIQVFQVGYQKVGGQSLCELPFEWRSDTLDISNPSNKHICCIEVNK